jgi:hypothetical protein
MRPVTPEGPGRRRIDSVKTKTCDQTLKHRSPQHSFLLYFQQNKWSREPKNVTQFWAHFCLFISGIKKVEIRGMEMWKEMSLCCLL